MDVPESQVHSFIVKLWLEKADDETGKTVWHGYITHVPGGERRYLKELRDILSFVQLYVTGMEAGGTHEEEQQQRTRSWLKLLKRRRR